MTQDHYDRLQAAMPAIANAVKLFSSEQIQLRVYDDLVGALSRCSGTDPGQGDTVLVAPPPEETPFAPPPVDTGANGAGARSASQPARPKRSGRGPMPKSWSPRNDINFRPAGKRSLREFREEKQPKGYQELNAVIIFWLLEIAQVSPIDVGHVMAGYRECDERIPKDLANSLSSTGARKGWLITADRADLKITPHGDNFVRHDLPRPVKSQK